ncbi:MAG TPA: polyprenyl synthetase family protein [Polyangiaceae bacterium]|jgi:geranylgeranyl diphosphate synthase type I
MTTTTAPFVSAFGELAREVKAAVESKLEAVASEKNAWALGIGPDVAAVTSALFDVATRGGKRVRPALLAAASVACGGSKTDDAIVEAGVALEILHAYLLAHDDWMDDDEVRRGGPSTHAALRARFDSRQMGDACAILAGDFGQAFAFEALATLPAPADRKLAAMDEVSRMLGDVVAGQVLDVVGAARSRDAVETMHRLKTSSYTTCSPLVLGAILAGAPVETREALRGAGDPLGVAFQLSDDWLGTFGDPEKTGKSVRSDLRRGKRTALVAELEEDRASRQLMPRVLGVEDAPDEEVDALVRRMVESGAKARVEARIATLLEETRERLAKIDLRGEGRDLLLGAVDMLGARQA